MNLLLPAPPAPFLELNFALNLLLVFASPIVNMLTLRASEFYELVLGMGHD